MTATARQRRLEVRQQDRPADRQPGGPADPVGFTASLAFGRRRLDAASCARRATRWSKCWSRWRSSPSSRPQRGRSSLRSLKRASIPRPAKWPTRCGSPAARRYGPAATGEWTSASTPERGGGASGCSAPTPPFLRIPSTTSTIRSTRSSTTYSSQPLRARAMQRSRPRRFSTWQRLPPTSRSDWVAFDSTGMPEYYPAAATYALVADAANPAQLTVTLSGKSRLVTLHATTGRVTIQ